MKRRLLAAVMLAVFLAIPGLAEAQPSKPNIVLVLMDNFGWGELGVYGGGVLRGAPTPRIDKLASEGIVCSISTSKRNARRAAPL